MKMMNTGRNLKVAYLSEEIVQKIEELLVDGDKVRLILENATALGEQRKFYTGVFALRQFTEPVTFAR